MGCVNIHHELETTLIVRTDWKRVPTGKHHSAFDTSPGLRPSVRPRQLVLFVSLVFSANSLTFTEVLAREQIFLITSGGDTSALQGKRLDCGGERGTAAGCCAAALPCSSAGGLTVIA